MKNLKNIILKKNNKKIFTPGPSSLSFENVIGLSPGFGRGDYEYQNVENRVLNKLKKMSKKKILPECKDLGVLQ